ncbi:hypothetical protein Tco_1202969 [Tanacetum coccineum]
MSDICVDEENEILSASNIYGGEKQVEHQLKFVGPVKRVDSILILSLHVVFLARVVQLGTTVQFGKSLIISLWFDHVDCHDYPCRGYHVISCVDLLFAIYLPRGSRRRNHTTWRRPLREEQRLGAWFVIFYTAVVELTLRVTINNGRRREVKYRQSQKVLVDISERITEHGLSSEITQNLGGSSDTSERSENSGSFEDYRSSCEGLML